MPPKSRRDWSKPPMRAYEPGKRHMELIPSVSRSSGLDKDGDALRNPEVQEEYRDFIQAKTRDYWKRFPYESSINDSKQRDEVQGNLLILFRKLREGLLSAKRSDAFALEVYETSLYLSVIFNSPAQTTSVITHLLPSMYQALPESSPIVASLLSSLHFLVSGYPSQSRYFEHLHSLPLSFLTESSPARSWLQDLARTLRTRNYSRLENLTSRETCEGILNAARAPRTAADAHQSRKYSYPIDLILEAMCTLMDSLRTKARETSWLVLRVAYRELTLPKASDSDPATTRLWLYKSLALGSVSRAANSRKINEIALLDTWIESCRTQGEIRAKEGVEGRWTVIKPKLG